MSFDRQSMQLLANLGAFPGLLSAEMQPMELELGALIITKTHDNALARFATNSPGGLAESFGASPEGTDAVRVGTTKPYGHRLNDGFDGSDSLGRVYHNQPTLFFSDAITGVVNSAEAMAIVQTGVANALSQMGGGI